MAIFNWKILDSPLELEVVPLQFFGGSLDFLTIFWQFFINPIYIFVPVGVETFGSWGPEGSKLIRSIGKKVIDVTGEKRSTSFLFQSISMAIQRGNASCVLGTVPHSEGLNEIFEFVSTDE